ncbi:MAG: hypothetical protein KC708_04120 [Anaerolineae bacterium]|nr:hypothetical protein [Anaerolineae bacterium]
MLDEPTQKPKRKPKQKRKIGRKSLLPLAIGTVTTVFLLLGITFLTIRQEHMSPCPPGAICEFGTSTPLPSLNPTALPLSSSTSRNLTISSLALFPKQDALLVGSYIDGQPSSAQVHRYPIANFSLVGYELMNTVPMIELGQYNLTSIQDIVQQPGGDMYAFASHIDQQVQLYFSDLDVLFSRFGDSDYSPISYTGYGDIAFSPDGRFYALAGENGLQILSADSLAVLSEEPYIVDEKFDVQAVAYSASGNVAVAYRRWSNGGMFYLKIWQYHDNHLEAVGSYPLSGMALEMHYHPFSDELAIATPVGVQFLYPGRDELHLFGFWNVSRVNSIAYAADGGSLLVAAHLNGTTGVVFQIPFGQDRELTWAEPADIPFELQRFDSNTTKMILSADGTMAYVGTNQGIIEVINLRQPD